MNEKIYNYKKNLIIKSVYEISQKLENKYPISRKYKIKINFKEKKCIAIICITILTIYLFIIILKINSKINKY